MSFVNDTTLITAGDDLEDTFGKQEKHNDMRWRIAAAAVVGRSSQIPICTRQVHTNRFHQKHMKKTQPAQIKQDLWHEPQSTLETKPYM